MKLDHNVAAVVTGGSKGLGAAAAMRLARHGVRVAVSILTPRPEMRWRGRSVGFSAKRM